LYSREIAIALARSINLQGQ